MARLRLSPPPAPLESSVLRQILDYLRYEQARGRIGAVFRINGGMSRNRAGAPVWHYRLWIPFAAESGAGMADVNGVYGPRSAFPGRFFALEVKRPGADASAPQIAYLEAIRASGGVAAVVRDFSEARLALFGKGT